MTLIFDTSIIIEIDQRSQPTISKLKELRVLYPAPPKITFMTYFEFIFGLRNKSSKNREKAIAFLESFEMVPLSRATAYDLAHLKGRYELALADLLIAAQVMETKAVLVTRDKDFEKIREIESIIL